MTDKFSNSLDSNLKNTQGSSLQGSARRVSRDRERERLSAMFPSNSQHFNHVNAVAIQDVPALNHMDLNESSAFMRNQASDGAPPYAESLMSNSKKLQDDLEKIGSKIKQHEDNLKFLKTQKNQLDDSILDMQVSLGKYISSRAPKPEDEDPSHVQSEEETIEQILKYEKTAAGILCQLKTRHAVQVSNLTSTQDVLGVVAMLGKVDDDNLGRLLSEYLGVETMLAVVCKSYEGIKALEMYDEEGGVNKGLGIHGLGVSIGRALEGRFLVICLESLRPYAGEFVADDPQRRLEIPKPRLPNGDAPPGFLGFAVNMITIDRENLYCLTPGGCGLRETLFYNLFSRLQVYRTRAEMHLALPCISDGSISLDGGIIRTSGMFFLGSRVDAGLRFPKSSTISELPERYFEIGKQIKQKRWEKERIQEDMQREQHLLDQAKFNFQIKKQEFVKFLADSSSYMTQVVPLLAFKRN
ncbi:hypothetical protein Nepgr_031470 [Nepenthes gracilis]|uniref:Protein DEFECTIVE IN MERISTEM SILENCING 3 n=1 Tax=Nepenthes gracilis TaxID=150966 RepID=A0AAD3TIY1_NEPGR|nr:hypothetical protein Nepgr_031470 [Nepenthes gracilis]